MFDLSIVIPVYNEEEVLPALFRELTKLVKKLTIPKNLGFIPKIELIFVNDGSTDKTEKIIKKLANNSDIPTTLINLTRNFGHQSALTAGYKYAQGKFIATIDADLQDPPLLIEKMYKTAISEKVDIVLAQRIKRDEGVFKKITATMFYKLIKAISDSPIYEEVADFRLISDRVRDTILKIDETPRFYRGLVSWSGYKTKIITYKRKPRYKGESKYSLKKMFNLATIALINYSSKIPMLWTIYAFLVLLLGVGFKWPSVVLFAAIFIPYSAILLIYLQNIYKKLQKKPEFLIDEIWRNKAYDRSEKTRKTKERKRKTPKRV